jgi:hypothetical protein
MTWPAVFAAVAVVTSVPALSYQAQDGSTEKVVTLRACVQPGNHGSPGSLKQVEVVAAGGTFKSPAVMYWFSKNLEGFRKYPGSQVEIVGSVIEVLTEPVELRAADGVFAEIPAAGGQAPAGEEQGPTVVKAEVTTLRSLGQCR